MCMLLAQLIIGFFFGAPVYSTNEASKSGGMRAIKQSIFLDVYDYESSIFTYLGCYF
jgi:hypothetical protein